MREARVADAGALAQLSGQLGYPTSEAEVSERLSSILGRAREAVWVAEQDGVAGWVHVLLCERVGSPPFAEVVALVVDEACRGNGLGRRLVEAAATWTRDRGVHRLRVRSQVRRTQTHEFYRAIGFEEVKAQRVFDRKLEA